ncbi:MAG: glycine--tRNA ligase subunit beta [Gammaproteobacteria bacterium]
MAKTKPFLVEIGTEELPPKNLKHLAESFHRNFLEQLVSNLLYPTHPSEGETFFSPRRLAVYLPRILLKQEDRVEERLGPAVNAAYDEQGQPTKAAEGFAKSCGVTVSQLEHRQTEKGERLAYTLRLKGKTAAELLPQIVSEALAKLPIQKRMRWGSGEVQFVRPVHWVVMLLGDHPLKAEILGVTASNKTYGHRFHHPAAITLKLPADYRGVLAKTGNKVLVEDRQGTLAKKVGTLVTQAAKRVRGNAQLDQALLEEVAALVEWPVPVTGRFDKNFLALPDEVIVAVLETQQRYFPLRDAKGKLLPYFIAISNIQSRKPAEVRRGNERVIVPRLTDAKFFWESDRKTTLESRIPALDRVVFQKQLGSYGDKSRRVSKLAVDIARQIGSDPHLAERAAQLAKCDLVTGMVGEFPELQGVMGGYYARHDKEPDEVARAIAEQYLPRAAGDILPSTKEGKALALSEKIDTVCGIFSIGGRPTGERDPFSLRRAALGILRILIETNLTLNLLPVLKAAVNAQPTRGRDAEADNRFAREEVFEFIQDRLRGYLLERKIGPELFEAVKAVRRPDGEPIDSPLDFVKRVNAIKNFMSRPEASSLAASYKRIRNILRQANEQLADGFSDQYFSHETERELGKIASELDGKLQRFLQGEQYDSALLALADLKNPLERFFADVMVMTDDQVIRKNRLGLLKRLESLCLRVADISCLSS